MENQGEPNYLPTGDVDSSNSFPTGDGITLSRKEYADIVAANSTLRAQLDMVVQSLQEQMDQSAQSSQAPTRQDHMPTGDVDSMTNTQLLGYIQQQMAAPILQSVMNLAIKEEIRECKSEFGDFDQFKDQVYKIASANTTVSLRDAYLQAKAGKILTADKVKSLPNAAPEGAAPPAPPTGLRPTQSAAGTSLQASSSLTTRDAALKALKESQYTD